MSRRKSGKLRRSIYKKAFNGGLKRKRGKSFKQNKTEEIKPMTEKDMLALLSYTIENPQENQLDFIEPRQGDQLLLLYPFSWGMTE